MPVVGGADDNRIDVFAPQQFTEITKLVLGSQRAEGACGFLPVLPVHIADRDYLDARLPLDRPGIAQPLSEPAAGAARPDASHVDLVVRLRPLRQLGDSLPLGSH